MFIPLSQVPFVVFCEDMICVLVDSGPGGKIITLYSSFHSQIIHFLLLPLLHYFMNVITSLLSYHTSDLEIGTPVATLPGAWHYRVSAETGWPGVCIL